MKKYIKPESEMLKFQVEDALLTCSSGCDYNDSLADDSSIGDWDSNSKGWSAEDWGE